MRKPIILLAITVLLFSCNSKDDKIIRKWQANSVTDTYADSLIRLQQYFIDTVGKTSDSLANAMRYGNLDSLKAVLQQELDVHTGRQHEIIRNTWFNFMADSVAFISFGGSGTDTCTWYVANKTDLILIDRKTGFQGNAIKMNIAELSDTSLKLTIKQPETERTITLRPVNK